MDQMPRYIQSLDSYIFCIKHTPAMFKSAVILAGLVAVVASQRLALPGAGDINIPTPYAFNYNTADVEGTVTRTESGDANGRVTGEYTMQLSDGRTRTVKYTADENGFRAEIITNELGTESKNPADVIIQSSAPTGVEAALQFESQRLKGRPSGPSPIYAPAPIPYRRR